MATKEVEEFLARGNKIKQIPIGVGKGFKQRYINAGERLTAEMREEIKRREKATPLGAHLTIDTGRREI